MTPKSVTPPLATHWPASLALFPDTAQLDLSAGSHLTTSCHTTRYLYTATISFFCVMTLPGVPKPTTSCCNDSDNLICNSFAFQEHGTQMERGDLAAGEAQLRQQAVPEGSICFSPPPPPPPPSPPHILPCMALFHTHQFTRAKSSC